MVVWVTSGLWTRRVFGDGIPYPGDGRPISIVTTVVLIGFIVAVSSLSFLGESLLSKYEKRRKRRIMRGGRPAKARVISIGESGEDGTISINGQPYLRLVLELNDVRGKPYIVDIDTVISKETIPMYQPGATVNVMVDKDDPKKVIIVP